MSIKTRQRTVRGVALISVMVVVAVVSASAVQLLYRQNIDIERSTRIMSREQAFLLVFGLETYARELLAKDNNMEFDYHFNVAGYNEETDPKRELWSWPIPDWGRPDHIPDEWYDTLRRVCGNRRCLHASVRDLSGLFNLNGVRQAVVFRETSKKKQNEWGWLEMYEGTFKNLINGQFAYDDEVPDADALWNALVDWFDTNSEVQEGSGAEDDEYLNYEQPYLTGQRRMAWPEEIRLIEGFDGRVADFLLPLVSALPRPARVKMNINTVDLKLLRHIPGVEDDDVSDISSRRGDDHWFSDDNSIKAFFGNSTGPDDPDPKRFFSARSEFFLFSACVRFGRDRPIEIQSLLYRKYLSKEALKQANSNKDKVVVLQRRMGSGYYKRDDCKAEASGGAPRGDPEEDDAGGF